MKNSASIPRVLQADAKQALRVQAPQILPALTVLFSELHYSEISHQRLSQQHNGSDLDYQGLTRAQHLQFGRIMIKWQLCANANQDLSDLIYEADVLTSINNLSNNQSNLQNSLSAIVPPLLFYENITSKILAQLQQLTILVMPYYQNGSLANQLSAQKHFLLTQAQKNQFILQSANLIYRLHNIGWLHNDIKPSNILLEGSLPNNADNSRITFDLLLTDFALARTLYQPSVANIAGTPAYLAPERWQGYGSTVQSDIYAFGIMLYEILVGERPFAVDARSSDPMIDWATQHCQQSVPTLPLEYSRYQDIVDKALAKQIEKRYQSMDEMLLDLESMEYGKVTELNNQG